jgi:hypothetical protein
MQPGQKLDDSWGRHPFNTNDAGYEQAGDDYQDSRKAIPHSHDTDPS